MTERIWNDIARSHVDANVPPPDKFQAMLRRDLALYFQKSKAEKVTVEPDASSWSHAERTLVPEVLRLGAVRVSGRLREEGAVRLAAVERKRLDVTDYLSATAIRKRPASLEQVFPRPVAARIRQRLALPAADE